MVAAHNGKFVIFLYLTEVGADVNVRDEETIVLFSLLLNRVVWIISSYYWIK